jgi:glycosyltransferase involved in cell wall biosynthesis
MKIWLINPYGPIPGEAWRDYRFTILGKFLAERGHDVVWWTANFSHHFKKYRSRGWQDVPVTEGFRIRLVLCETVFCGRTYLRGAGEARPDFIIGVDPPQSVGLTSVRLARRHRTPVVLDVFDLWPELFVLAIPRRLRPLAPAILAPWYRMRRQNLRSADAIASLCNTYLDVARSQVPALRESDSLTVFNGIDIAAFRSSMASAEDAAALAVKMGKASDAVWAIYAGSLGPNYDIPTLLEAAVLLEQRRSRARILIAGDGPLLPLVKSFIASRHLDTISFLGNLTHQELARTFQACDVGLCAYGQHSNVAMPDKAYDYMAAGLPIVNSLRGELERFLAERDIGVQYRAGDAASLADALEHVVSDPEGRRRMARHSSEAAAEFDTRLQYSAYVDFVERVARERAPTLRSRLEPCALAGEAQSREH